MENKIENENESGIIKVRLLYLGATKCRKDGMVCSAPGECSL